MPPFTESIVEEAALEWLRGLRWTVAPGEDLLPGAGERPSTAETILPATLRESIRRLNPDLPAEACDEAARKLMRAEGASLIDRNRVVHRMLVEGVNVEYRRPD